MLGEEDEDREAGLCWCIFTWLIFICGVWYAVIPALTYICGLIYEHNSIACFVAIFYNLADIIKAIIALLRFFDRALSKELTRRQKLATKSGGKNVVTPKAMHALSCTKCGADVRFQKHNPSYVIDQIKGVVGDVSLFCDQCKDIVIQGELSVSCSGCGCNLCTDCIGCEEYGGLRPFSSKVCVKKRDLAGEMIQLNAVDNDFLTTICCHFENAAIFCGVRGSLSADRGFATGLLLVQVNGVREAFSPKQIQYMLQHSSDDSVFVFSPPCTLGFYRVAFAKSLLNIEKRLHSSSDEFTKEQVNEIQVELKNLTKDYSKRFEKHFAAKNSKRKRAGDLQLNAKIRRIEREIEIQYRKEHTRKLKKIAEEQRLLEAQEREIRRIEIQKQLEQKQLEIVRKKEEKKKRKEQERLFKLRQQENLKKREMRQKELEQKQKAELHQKQQKERLEKEKREKAETQRLNGEKKHKEKRVKIKLDERELKEAQLKEQKEKAEYLEKQKKEIAERRRQAEIKKRQEKIIRDNEDKMKRLQRNEKQMKEFKLLRKFRKQMEREKENAQNVKNNRSGIPRLQTNLRDVECKFDGGSLQSPNLLTPSPTNSYLESAHSNTLTPSPRIPPQLLEWKRFSDESKQDAGFHEARVAPATKWNVAAESFEPAKPSFAAMYGTPLGPVKSMSPVGPKLPPSKPLFPDSETPLFAQLSTQPFEHFDKHFMNIFERPAKVDDGQFDRAIRNFASRTSIKRQKQRVVGPVKYHCDEHVDAFGFERTMGAEPLGVVGPAEPLGPAEPRGVGTAIVKTTGTSAISEEYPDISFAELRELRVRLQELEDEKLCAVCMDRHKNVALHPCGHAMFCMHCTEHLQQCPICRQKILSRAKIFTN